MEAASPSKAPGLDGLSYEFYKATFAWVGPPLLEAYNEMLASGLMAPSMRQGVVRLLPKVPGVPMASQIRPITLLGTDYKLLKKMFLACLLPLLPSFLHANQLFSVQGRSIHDGPASADSYTSISCQVTYLAWTFFMPMTELAYPGYPESWSPWGLGPPSEAG